MWENQLSTSFLLKRPDFLKDDHFFPYEISISNCFPLFPSHNMDGMLIESERESTNYRITQPWRDSTRWLHWVTAREQCQGKNSPRFPFPRAGEKFQRKSWNEDDLPFKVLTEFLQFLTWFWVLVNWKLKYFDFMLCLIKLFKLLISCAMPIYSNPHHAKSRILSSTVTYEQTLVQIIVFCISYTSLQQLLCY